MDTTCKWLTTGILLVVFFALIALAGCLHVAEYFGAITISTLGARWFYTNVCRGRTDLPVQRRLPGGRTAHPAA
jgi:hypothetical protein